MTSYCRIKYPCQLKNTMLAAPVKMYGPKNIAH